jgi:hypothetical protein
MSFVVLVCLVNRAALDQRKTKVTTRRYNLHKSLNFNNLSIKLKHLNNQIIHDCFVFLSMISVFKLNESINKTFDVGTVSLTSVIMQISPSKSHKVEQKMQK